METNGQAEKAAQSSAWVSAAEGAEILVVTLKWFRKWANRKQITRQEKIISGIRGWR